MESRSRFKIMEIRENSRNMKPIETECLLWKDSLIQQISWISLELVWILPCSGSFFFLSSVGQITCIPFWTFTSATRLVQCVGLWPLPLLLWLTAAWIPPKGATLWTGRETEKTRDDLKICSLQNRRILGERALNIPSSVYKPPSWIWKTLEARGECKRTPPSSTRPNSPWFGESKMAAKHSIASPQTAYIAG